MKIKITDLKASEYSESIYSSEPSQDLIESIGRNGVIVPIWITKDNIIISGHRRVNACKALGYEEIETEIKKYSDSLVIESNRYREKTWKEKLAEKRALEKILKPEAKKKQSEGGKKKVCQNFDKPINTKKEIAVALGTSYETIRKVAIIEKEDIALFDKLNEGNVTVDSAYNRIVQKKETERTASNLPEELPQGQYKTIVIDPPWPIKKILREETPKQNIINYPTMSIENIEKIDIKRMYASEGTHIFLWTTHKFLFTSLEILKKWEASYILTMVWHKNGGFQPFGLPQYNCEFILYGKSGPAKFLETKNFFTCFSANRTGHSRKPDEFYDLIKRVCPTPRIEIFSRDKREGFEQYGNEQRISNKQKT